MINNVTIINKTNNHISPQFIEHRKTMTYIIRNPGHGWGHVQTTDDTSGQ